MMSPQIALHNPVFRAYCAIVVVGLVCGGIVLAFVQYGFKKELGSIWATYRSWIVMALIGLLCVFGGRIAVIVGVGVLSLLAFREFARVSGLAADEALVGTVYAGIIALALASFVRRYDLFAILPLVVIAAILIVPVLKNRSRGAIQKTAAAIVGFVYVGWMFGHLGFLANFSPAYGLICYVIFATELTDIAAFTFGKLFGRHALRSQISPRKTVEGAIGALAVAMILPWALRFSFPSFGAIQLIIIGLIVGIGGMLGDLSVSMLKRDLDTKDMGSAIPGHGGILDRIDSLIYVAPLFMHMTKYCQAFR